MRGSTARMAAATGLALTLVGSAAAAPPKADGASVGPLYDIGTPAGLGYVVGNWNARRAGDEWEITAPTGAATPGPRWWIDWDVCGLGATVTELRWQAARSTASSSPLHAFRVTDTGATTYATSGNLRDELAGAIYPTRRTYAAATGYCKAQLRIDQAIGGPGADPVKQYWVTAPRAIVRDVQPPQVRIDAVPGGWFTGNDLPVSWTTSDNFDGSGIGFQHLIIDGIGDRSTPGSGYWFRQVGALQGTANLAGVPDGTQTLRVRVDGDGTGAGEAIATFALDRTPPAANITVTRTGPGTARVDVSTEDSVPGSGTADWSVSLPDGSVVASRQSGPGALASVNLLGRNGDPRARRRHRADGRARPAPVRLHGWVHRVGSARRDAR
ncbi:MAG: hypothetical protein HYX33_02235 [Actinobacteria bacterium]|nr:hypothetical protein [Actinomycetota bacterium]